MFWMMIKAYIFAYQICDSAECRIENVRCMREWESQTVCTQLVGEYYARKRRKY